MKEEGIGIKKIVLVIFCAIVLYTISQNISNILNILTTILNIFLPSLLGCVIAFILNIPMNLIERNILKIKVVKTNKKLYKIVRPLSMIISIIFACYILLQRETLARQIKKVLYAFLSKEKTEYIL